MHEAGYFHAISQNSKLTVNFVQISEKALISRAAEQISELEPDMILLYTNKENMELLMQQVIHLKKFDLTSLISPYNITT